MMGQLSEAGNKRSEEEYMGKKRKRQKQEVLPSLFPLSNSATGDVKGYDRLKTQETHD
uniref:Uncharacterized protein n=1 Tax=Rhizophora mucronata TaxID=61149 RepID=A0A2P2JNY3_RHIMU